MKGVLVWAETHKGKLKKAACEAIGAARELAMRHDVSAAAVVINGGEAVNELRMLGLARIYTVDEPIFESYSSEGYTHAVAAAGDDWGADVYLIGATALGRDLSARLAARLDAALATDVIEIDWDSKPVRVIRPVYSGKLLAEIDLKTDMKVISLRPNVFDAAQEHDQAAEVTALPLTDPTIKATVKEALEAAQDVLDVSEADIIVSGGRGVGGPEGFKVVEDLAKAIGGAVGASRVAVDEGWIPYPHQVGQTGKVVTPVLYVACGISGAIQHFAGMGSSKFVIAINKDPDAPIMKKADFAIVGDLFKVVPLLKDELVKARQP
jgi:electron transfer flavoprotein alpha subunit